MIMQRQLTHLVRQNVHILKASLHSSPAIFNKNSELANKAIQDAETVADAYKKHVDTSVAGWAKCNEIYYGKDRDMTNFPPLKVVDQHPPVRFGFLPDSWFQALYEKTGVSGPYMLGIGAATYLLSKEFVVYDGHLVEFLPFAICTTFLIKKLAPYVVPMRDEHLKKVHDATYYKPMQKVRDCLEETIATAEEEIARASALPLLAAAKKENCELQLETEYRSRLQNVHKTVQRRLDYHVARESTTKRFQQEHMVKWIVGGVLKGITPEQEKATIANCIAELQQLGKRQAATA